MLVDALATVAEASAPADWVALHHRNLTTIYITHGHFDHYFGLAVLLARFRRLGHCHAEIGAVGARASRCFAGLRPAMLAGPGPGGDHGPRGLRKRRLHLGGPRTAHSRAGPHRHGRYHLAVRGGPDLVVAGDVLYNECHMFVGDTTAASRTEWTAALDRLAALNPRVAIAGHKKPVPLTHRRPSRPPSGV